MMGAKLVLCFGTVKGKVWLWTIYVAPLHMIPLSYVDY